MTEIIARGTGSAFTMKGHQTNFLVKRNGKYLLIDCGSDIRWSLAKIGLSFKDIDAVYVSHAHADHIGGMEWLGFTRYFTRKGMIAGGDPNPLPLPTLFCERGMVQPLWDHSLRGGMEGLEGIDATIDTYFNVHPVDKNSDFVWEGLTFDMVQSLHISAKYCIVDSFGLMFDDIDTAPEGLLVTGPRVYITTDVQFAPETAMKAYYEESDVIIHDCETMYKSGVHAHYDDLRTLKPEVKTKMRLIHYQDNVLEDWDSWQSRATKEDGFYGFLKPGVIYASDEAVFKDRLDEIQAE
jgi:ribonuclease BN (tRNA processing enzyme)